MSRRVYLHVGAPKTGTTYLQDRLALNAASLRRRGYRYPTGPHQDMFLAALDLLDRPWGGMRPQAEGEWDRLVRRVRRAGGTTVVSHEILAGAKPAEARRALSDLSFAEVHVVYSARDVARQVAAEWQEQLKHQRKVSFASFLDQLRQSDQRKATRWFWRVQGLPGVLERWGGGLTPAQVHVVTVPRPGGPPEALWHRFCTALGIDPAWAPLEGARRNPSIGTAESTLLRRVNAQLKDAGLPSDQYRALVHRLGESLESDLPEAALKAILGAYPAAAELYENRHYEKSGLMLSPLERSVETEMMTSQALHRIAKAAKGQA